MSYQLSALTATITHVIKLLIASLWKNDLEIFRLWGRIWVFSEAFCVAIKRHDSFRLDSYPIDHLVIHYLVSLSLDACQTVLGHPSLKMGRVKHFFVTRLTLGLFFFFDSCLRRFHSESLMLTLWFRCPAVSWQILVFLRRLVQLNVLDCAATRLLHHVLLFIVDLIIGQQLFDVFSVNNLCVSVGIHPLVQRIVKQIVGARGAMTALK